MSVAIETFLLFFSSESKMNTHYHFLSSLIKNTATIPQASRQVEIQIAQEQFVH